MTDRWVLEVDEEGRRVLVAALDLLQRVAMGQWRDVAEHAPQVVADNGLFGEAAEGLMAVRCAYATDPALAHPNASLSIRQAGREALVGYDLWHALGDGMASRRDDRLAGVHVEVRRGAHLAEVA